MSLSQKLEILDDEIEISLFEIAQSKKELFDDGDWIEAEHITDNGIRLIQTGNIGIGKFEEKDKKKYIFEDSFLKLKCKPLRAGDLLVCRLAEPAGRACVLPELEQERIITSVDVTIFRPPADVANRQYLANLFSTEDWFKAVRDRSGGTTHKRIARGTLGKIRVRLPNLATQNAIAAALSDADALIEALESLIVKKRAIKQGAMQELLSGRRRLLGFSGEWQTKCFGEALSIQHGKAQHEVAVSDGPYPILATGGQIGTASSFLYDKPSVLIGRKGTIDRPQYIETPFWTVDTLFYSVMKGGNSAKFFFYRFCLIDWYSHNEASGVPSLNARTIERIEVAVPEPDEQKAIAGVLSEMDEELEVLTERLTKARQIKQGMMQELLTGRVRLV